MNVTISGVGNGPINLGECSSEDLIAIEINGVPLVGLDLFHLDTENNDVDEAPYVTIGWWGPSGDIENEDHPWHVLASLPSP